VFSATLDGKTLARTVSRKEKLCNFKLNGFSLLVVIVLNFPKVGGSEKLRLWSSSRYSFISKVSVVD